MLSLFSGNWVKTTLTMSKQYKFALIPNLHRTHSVASVGCEQRATELGVECLVSGSDAPDTAAQAKMLREYVDAGIDGIALSVVDSPSNSTLEAIAYAVERGVPVVTFETDAANSKRMAYIGTDNFALGDHMGKVRRPGKRNEVYFY